jgi:hypothetical protein
VHRESRSYGPFSFQDHMSAVVYESQDSSLGIYSNGGGVVHFLESNRLSKLEHWCIV